ncbi:MAG: dihydropteroate synthase [Planctomycetota bacterium]|nr:dihydropteroate synthase [Planctomycetota bacterium]
MPASQHPRCGEAPNADISFGFRVRLSLHEPVLIAIINTSPDSFYSASVTPPESGVENALAAVVDAVAAGAAVVDVGGQSTRPGAAGVSPEEQISRVVPLIRAIRSSEALSPAHGRNLHASPRAAGSLPNQHDPAALAARVRDIPISVDTTSAEVAAAALEAGADAINDVSAGLDDPAMLALAASRRAGLVLMHRLRPPSADSYSDRYTSPPAYTNVVSDVAAFLRERLEAAIAAGVDPRSIVLDPGLGFGKTVQQNLELIRATPTLLALGRPILSALSRKSFVGRVSLERDSEPSERLAGTLALSLNHWNAGARLFRVHDIAAHAQAFRAWSAATLPINPT